MRILETAPHRAILDLEEHLELTPETLAGALGVERRTIARWRSGTDYPRTRARSSLAMLYEFHDRLLYTFSPRDARGWLQDGNEYLGGLSPLEALKAGRIDRALDALEALESGVFV